MKLLTLVMIAMVLGFIYMVLWTAYDIGRRKGCRDCAPDVERADRYMNAVNDLDKWCGNQSPQARLIAAHLFSAGEGLQMNAGTPCGDEPCTISGLREQLRRLALVEEGK